ncbi:MAG: DUF4340 domain-containing protein [bacterium]
MRLRNTAVLALLLLALGAYLYFVESKHIAVDDKKEKILDVVADDVTAVTLTYPDREIDLEKRDGVWHMTKPVDAVADDVTVKNLLRAIAEAEVKKTIDDPPADLAPFGLAQPMATIVLTTNGGALPALKIGKTTAVSFSTYVQRADQPKLYLTGSGFHAGMDKQPKDLRDKTILSLNDADVTAITLSGPGGPVELAKHDGNWQIERPSAHRADNNAVRALLSSIRNLRATDFANDNPAPADLAAYGLDSPQRQIMLRAGDKDITLQVGKEFEQGLYVRPSDRSTVFVVGKWADRDLDKGVNDLRDKTLLTFDSTQAATLEIARGDGSNFSLVAKDGKWSLLGSDQPLDATTVDTFVGALSRLTGTQVLTEAATDLSIYGLEPPAVTITVKGEDGATIGTVALGSYSPNPPATEFTGMRSGDAAVFQLRDNQFKQLDKKAGDFVQAPKAAAPAAAPAEPEADE